MKSSESPYQFLDLSAAPARGNVTVFVTDTLRRAIVTLAMKPGEVLDKGAICDRLGVSRFPVSEALARLQAEGLVDILPQRGSIVSLVRIAEVSEYMLIRKALESEAVRALIGSQTPKLIEALHANMSHQLAAAEADDQAGFHERDLEFHDLLFGAMKYGRIKAVIEGARANLDRARRLILNPRRLSDTMTEHTEILEGIIARDSDRAAKAMRAHIDSVMAELLVFARQKPDLFADGAELAATGDQQYFPFG